MIRFGGQTICIWESLGHRGFLNWMDDERYLMLVFKDRLGYPLNLDNPQTFNEKLQWLKIHDRDPLYTQLVDKYEVREYIAEKIGEEHLIPLVGGPWEHFDDIDFDALPNQFVLKCTHDSGGLIICKDKSKLDKKGAKQKIEKCLKHNYYWCGREWPYKNVKPRIIAEEYMTEMSGKALDDYKFMVFNGRYKCMFVCSNRFSKDGLNVTFFDTQWNRMPFERKYHADPDEIEKPYCYDEMVQIAESLSENKNFVRVDLYEIDHRVYFSELTFFPGDGTERFYPEEWDRKLGNLLCLPQRV